MLSLVASCIVAAQQTPYNYLGKFADLAIEGAEWGNPGPGLPVTITLTDGGKTITVGASDLKGKGWSSASHLSIDGLAYSDRTLSGDVSFKNTSGLVLEGVRFDADIATESYKTKDADGKEIVATRAQSASEESPLLLGDLQPNDSAAVKGFRTAGLKWNPETVSITVTARLTGFAYARTACPAHLNSSLAFDAKGRLLLGSGEQAGIYRWDPAANSVDLLCSLPDRLNFIDSNPITGEICTRWANSHEYHLLNANGDDVSTLAETADNEAMNGWPRTGRYDAKGNLFCSFGGTISRFVAGKPFNPVKKVAGFEFSDPLFSFLPDGRLLISTPENVLVCDQDGSNGRKLIQGPHTRLGRTHGIQALRGNAQGQIWTAELNDSEFMPRVQVYDSAGHFLWVLGRGGQSPVEAGAEARPGTISATTTDFAFAADGKIYISGATEATSVMEFIPF